MMTIEEAEKKYRDMCDAVAENTRLRGRVKEYKSKILKNEFKLNINWQKDINNVNLSDLKSPLSEDLIANLTDNNLIIELNLDKIVNSACEDANKVFPTDKLWKVRASENIVRLIETIESEIKIIPPIIKFLENNTVAIIDGNHRIAISRFLKLEKIPFIISKDDLSKFQEFKH
jgi:hypothetical protein